MAQRDLKTFFEQWTQRTGAPVLAVEDVAVQQDCRGSSKSSARWCRRRRANPMLLEVPVTSQNSREVRQRPLVTCAGAVAQTFAIARRCGAVARCTSIPSSTCFGLLDPRETPASIGQIFGEPKVLAVLPSAATEHKTKAVSGTDERVEERQPHD